MTVTPKGGRDEKILVATDGSEAAQAAMSWAADFAASADVKAVATTVVEPFQRSRPRTDRTQEVGHILEEWALPLTQRGVDCEFSVLNGEGSLHADPVHG